MKLNKKVSVLHQSFYCIAKNKFNIRKKYFTKSLKKRMTFAKKNNNNL